MDAVQQARPSADVTIEGWSPPPLYERLDEAEPDDGDFVESPSDPEGATFEVRLSALAWPKTGTQTLRFRLRKTAAEDVPATVFLLQGNAILAFSRVEPTTAFATYALELSQEQVHAITDYTDLRVRVMAGVKKVTTTCCANAIATILTATITNKTGGHACLPDSLFLVWNGFYWVADVEDCNPTGLHDVYLACAAGFFGLQSNFGMGGSVTLNSCDPLSLTIAATGSAIGHPDGTSTWTIDEWEG